MLESARDSNAKPHILAIDQQPAESVAEIAVERQPKRRLDQRGGQRQAADPRRRDAQAVVRSADAEAEVCPERLGPERRREIEREPVSRDRRYAAEPRTDAAERGEHGVEIGEADRNLAPRRAPLDHAAQHAGEIARPRRRGRVRRRGEHDGGARLNGERAGDRHEDQRRDQKGRDGAS